METAVRDQLHAALTQLKNAYVFTCGSASKGIKIESGSDVLSERGGDQTYTLLGGDTMGRSGTTDKRLIICVEYTAE